MHLIGGFSGIPGSFAGISWTTSDLLHFNETLNLTGEFGDRTRGMQLTVAKPSAFGSSWKLGFTLYGQRLHYNE